MGTTHAQVTLPYTTGLPGDVATNNFYFDTVAAPTVEQQAAIFDGITLFYNGSIGSVTLASFIGPTVSRTTNACRIKLYNEADPLPRQPFAEHLFTLGAVVGSSGMPQEVAVCASFRANYVSGQPAARRRGRVYIGPLAPGAADTSGMRPHNNLLNRLIDGMQILAITADTEAVNWCVYSTVDHVARVVTRVWVDNAFDTQRRRGLQATTRIEEEALA